MSEPGSDWWQALGGRPQIRTVCYCPRTDCPYRNHRKAPQMNVRHRNVTRFFTLFTCWIVLFGLLALVLLLDGFGIWSSPEWVFWSGYGLFVVGGAFLARPPTAPEWLARKVWKR